MTKCLAIASAHASINVPYIALCQRRGYPPWRRTPSFAGCFSQKPCSWDMFFQLCLQEHVSTHDTHYRIRPQIASFVESPMFSQHVYCWPTISQSMLAHAIWFRPRWYQCWPNEACYLVWAKLVSVLAQ